MRSSIYLLLVSLFLPSYSITFKDPIPAQANENFTTYVSLLNYPVETHNVTTSDGYILTYYRIQAKNSVIKPNLPVIYIQHGLVDSCDSFVTNTEDQAPGLILANAGYDVWLGNNRGNKYSLGHVDPATYNSTDRDGPFWNFSWQEMSLYDLPAGFQYIASYTGSSVNYMSHSEGSTIMFAALARRDATVLSVLDKFVALAPAVFIQDSTSPLVRIVGDINDGDIPKDLEIFLDRKTYGFMTPADRYEWEFICSEFLDICIERVRLISDANTTVDNVQRLPIFSGHFPAGTSLQNMAYWQQMLDSQDFQMYDYGSAGNQKMYGTSTPPVYDLAGIKETIHMFVGLYDELASLNGTMKLRDSLTGAKKVGFHEYPLGHASFVNGLYVSTYMDEVIKVLQA